MGTFPVDHFVFEWTPGVPSVVGNTSTSSNPSGTDIHSYAPGTHTLNAWVVDEVRGTKSNALSTTFVVLERVQPTASITCDETTLEVEESVECDIDADVSAPASIDSLAYTISYPENSQPTKSDTVAVTSLPHTITISSEVEGTVEVTAKARATNGLWGDEADESVAFVFSKPEITSFTCPDSVYLGEEFICNVQADGGTYGIELYELNGDLEPNGDYVEYPSSSSEVDIPVQFRVYEGMDLDARTIDAVVYSSPSIHSDAVSTTVALTKPQLIAEALPGGSPDGIGYTQKNSSYSIDVDYHSGAPSVDVTGITYQITGPINASGSTNPNEPSGTWTIDDVPTSEVGTYDVEIKIRTPVDSAVIPTTYTVVNSVGAEVSFPQGASANVGGTLQVQGAATQKDHSHRLRVEATNLTTDEDICSNEASSAAVKCVGDANTSQSGTFDVQALAMGATSTPALNEALGENSDRDEYEVASDSLVAKVTVTGTAMVGQYEASASGSKASSGATITNYSWEIPGGAPSAGTGPTVNFNRRECHALQPGPGAPNFGTYLGAATLTITDSNNNTATASGLYSYIYCGDTPPNDGDDGEKRDEDDKGPDTPPDSSDFPDPGDTGGGGRGPEGPGSGI